MQEQTEMETAETQTTKKLHPISPKMRQHTDELCEAHTESPPYQESHLKQSAVTVQPQPLKQHHQELRFVSDTEVAQTNVSSNTPPKPTPRSVSAVRQSKPIKTPVIIRNRAKRQQYSENSKKEKGVD
jgi:hypothetical protein